MDTEPIGWRAELRRAARLPLKGPFRPGSVSPAVWRCSPRTLLELYAPSFTVRKYYL